MKLEFTLEQLAVLDKALQQQPYYIAAPLIVHINRQLEEQQKINNTPIDLMLTEPNSHSTND